MTRRTKSENRIGPAGVHTKEKTKSTFLTYNGWSIQQTPLEKNVNEAKIRTLLGEIDDRTRAIRGELTPVDPLACFIAERCYDAPGESILFVDFWAVYRAWTKERGIKDHRSKGQTATALPDKYPYGVTHSNRRHIGNLSFTKPYGPSRSRLALAKGGKLKRELVR
jgi:hypothetical protein